LNVGDVLYFTGLIEGFGGFCEEHGLVATDHLEQLKTSGNSKTTQNPMFLSSLRTGVEGKENPDNKNDPSAMEIGVTKESLMEADEAERSRRITRMIGELLLLVKHSMLWCNFRFSFSVDCYFAVHRLDSWCREKPAEQDNGNYLITLFHLTFLVAEAKRQSRRINEDVSVFCSVTKFERHCSKLFNSVRMSEALAATMI
jgi:hypothetical protein